MNRQGFTLLELMIAMTIVFLVSVSLYAPYGHYQNKAHLKLGSKQIEQFLTQARNSAVYGTASGSNLSFGLYIAGDPENRISLLSYPFDIADNNISRSDISDSIESQILFLEPGVVIESVGGNENMLLFFESVSGDLKLYGWDESWVRNPVLQDVVDIDISYKAATSSHLQNTLTYYTKTNVTDY